MRLHPHNILYPKTNFTPDFIHKAGNIYLMDDDCYCILACISYFESKHEVALIGLDNLANRWNDPKIVKDWNCLTDKEWLDVAGLSKGKFIGRIENTIKYGNYLISELR